MTASTPLFLLWLTLFVFIYSVRDRIWPDVYDKSIHNAVNSPAPPCDAASNLHLLVNDTLESVLSELKTTAHEEFEAGKDHPLQPPSEVEVEIAVDNIIPPPSSPSLPTTAPTTTYAALQEEIKQLQTNITDYYIAKEALLLF